MIGAVPSYPNLPTPEGWTREQRGPRVWLVPPGPGGRIVLPPLQERPQHVSPQMYLDQVIVQEVGSFPQLKQSTPVTVTSAQQYPGLVVDLAGLDAAGEPVEWRTYVLFATPALFALAFLQSAPARFAELRPIFLTAAAALEVPEGGTPVQGGGGPMADLL